MAKRLIGAHMPTAGGLHKAVRNGAAIGCTAVQVFTSSPQRWSFQQANEQAAAEFRQAVEETGVVTVSHDSYLVNLASPDGELRSKSREALAAELGRCATLGIPAAVSHVGAHMGAGEDEGAKRAAEGLLAVLAETPDSVSLLMETTAGQGTVLNWRFEHVASLLDLCGGHSRLGVCLDTCHVFAAGYDLSSAEATIRMVEKFDQVVGLARLRCVHANDSKHPRGSRKDRHEHIGKGEIGESAFAALLSDARLEDVPFVVETPDAEECHAVNVAALWRLAGERVPA